MYYFTNDNIFWYMSTSKKIVWHNLQLRPTIYGLIFGGVGGKLAVEKAGEYQSWYQLQREQITVPATVLSDHTLLSSSGKVVGHELTYEFVAPGSGSRQSSAEIQAQLQEQFLNGETDFSIDEEALAEPLPEGQQFVRGEQLVKPNDYRDLTLNGPINVIYAESAPEISAITNTNAGPSLPPTLITLLMIAGGCWFLWQGIKRCFNPPPEPNIPDSNIAYAPVATTESSHHRH